MLLLPIVKPDYVHTGWWRNLAAPTYRQYLWTATNLEVALVLGSLAIVGTVASDRLWTILRRCLQPALQLSDPESKRLRLSRSDAIKALWCEIITLKKDLTSAWSKKNDKKDGSMYRTNLSLHILRDGRRKTLHPMETTIELRFGIFALLNILSFFVLGIFIPFFLAEGLQGEAVVQASGSRHFLNYTRAYWIDRSELVYNEGVSQSVEWDAKRCFAELGVWKKTDYCVKLRNSLPSYTMDEMDTADPVFDEKPYRFLKHHGDPRLKAFRLRRNTSLQDVGFNTAPGPNMFHELTCLPVFLDPLIHQAGRYFSLEVENLNVTQYSRTNYTRVLDSMVLKTSNAEGSGFELYESYHRREDYRASYPDIIDRGATLYQPTVDGTLPYIRGSYSNRVMSAGSIILSQRDKDKARYQNFLITFSPTQQLDLPAHSSDDPIFGTYRPSGSGTDFALRELSALGCTEIYKFCSANTCLELPSSQYVKNRENNIWIHRCYLELISVWLNLLVGSIYSDPGRFGGTRNFFERGRWQEEVEERFIRSMLRVRHSSKLAAERDFLRSNPPDMVHSQLYGNAEFTNVNILGFVSVACGYLYIIAASYWAALLLPLTVPIRLFSQGATMAVQRLQTVIYFGQFWTHLASNTVQKQLRRTVP